MEKDIFDQHIQALAQKDPLLFALEADDRATEESLCKLESRYGFGLPEAYRAFVKQYGGGYFGYTVVFSCDENGMFYLGEQAAPAWIQQHAFLPAIDLETGDYLGFAVQEGVCQETISLYDHEEDALTGLDMDFYEALLKYGFHMA